MDREGGYSGSCYYSVLGIRKDASFSDVRAAYRKLALVLNNSSPKMCKWHPDRWTAKNPAEAGEANQRFQKIQEAYSVLSDEGKRSMYDAGVLDLFGEDEGMDDFMYDLLKMMDSNEVTGKGETLEDLQRSFVETFGSDLANFYWSEDPTAKKRARDGATNARAAKRSTSSRC